jgi:hypothetical protein
VDTETASGACRVACCARVRPFISLSLLSARECVLSFRFRFQPNTAADLLELSPYSLHLESELEANAKFVPPQRWIL